VSGVATCVSAGGCRQTGESCASTPLCCGGGIQPQPDVVCDTGRCDNGQSCNPVGNICGAPLPYGDGGTISVPASQNCCNGQKDVCKLDSQGLPRCFGGASTTCPTGYTGVAPCCIAFNQPCQFSDQCCSGAKCIPGNDGGLQCAPPPACAPLGNPCSPTADAGTSLSCCNPNQCLSQNGGNFCGVPPPPPPDGGNPADGGGTPDAGPVCTPNGLSCTASNQCCSKICTNGVCMTAPVCQPLGSGCLATADCCSGLTCSIPAGATSGTCAQATCIGAGQTCAQGSSPGCCNGLSCLTAGGFPCGTTGACSCSIIIN
jgi:hypothetical protein